MSTVIRVAFIALACLAFGFLLGVRHVVSRAHEQQGSMAKEDATLCHLAGKLYDGNSRICRHPVWA